jgi:anti-anti-sigma regulatory factor
VMADEIKILRLPKASQRAQPRAVKKDLFAALQAAGPRVILDLSGQSTLNQADLDLVLDCAARTAGRGVQLSLVATSPATRLLLEVTRVASVLPVFTSMAEALAQPTPTVDPNSPCENPAETSSISGASPSRSVP